MEQLKVVLEDGFSIHCLASGKPDNPPLVLLHGYPVHSALWRNCIPALESSFRIYAPDLPGHGESDKLVDGEYNLDFFVSSLLGFLDQLGLDRVHLACHDLGAMIGLGLAARHPDRIEKLVIMDTAPYADWPLLNRVMFSLFRWKWTARLILLRFVFGLVCNRVASYRPTAFSREAVDMYLESWVKDRDSRKAFSRLMETPPERIIEPVSNLKNIQARTLILWARNDRIFPTSLAKRLQSDIHGSKLVLVPECGHFIPEEKPEQVAGELLTFFNDPTPLENRNKLNS